MYRLAVVLAVALGLVLPSTAAAVPYLTFGEASRQIGRHLHGDYYVESGSLDTVCERYKRNKVACDFTFWFQDGDLGCGYGQVIETRTHYKSRLSNVRVCG